MEIERKEEKTNEGNGPYLTHLHITCESFHLPDKERGNNVRVSAKAEDTMVSG